VKVWESGAILLYLQKKYDHKNKLAGKNAQEEADILSLLFFQVSGHG
jgi:glutathione S-transferase